MTKQSRAKRIADLNDKFRKSLVTGGRTYMTAGVNGKGPEFVAKALVNVIAFDDFNADNDPHREHDFGSFELEGEQLFWKSCYTANATVRLWTMPPSLVISTAARPRPLRGS